MVTSELSIIAICCEIKLDNGLMLELLRAGDVALLVGCLPSIHEGPYKLSEVVPTRIPSAQEAETGVSEVQDHLATQKL